MNSASRLFVYLALLQPIWLVAQAGPVQIDPESASNCGQTFIGAGTPSISENTTAEEITARLRDLGNNRVLVSRTKTSVRAFNLDHLVCDPGPREFFGSIEQELEENDQVAAKQLLFALFLRPIATDDQIADDYPPIRWRYVSSKYNFAGNLVSTYQQTIGGVPIANATADVEFGKYGEITGLSAFPVNIEKYLDLASAYAVSERAMSAGRPAPPTNLAIDDEAQGEPEISIYLGRGDGKPTAAWRYKSADNAKSAEFYDVLVEAESGEVLEKSGLDEKSENVLADGTATLSSNEVLEFPVDCLTNRQDCKLLAKKQIGNKTVSVSVRTNVAVSGSTEFESSTEVFSAPEGSDTEAAVFVYAYIWQILDVLLAEDYLADVRPTDLPDEINVILTKPGNAPGKLERGTLYFARLKEEPDVEHGGLDRHIIGHELVHLLLRSTRNPKIVSDECTGSPGEQFAAAGESLADILAVLLEAELLDKAVASRFGVSALGRQYRNLRAPGKSNGFDIEVVQQRIDNGDALDEVFRDINFSQPENLLHMVPNDCQDEPGLKNVKYINMGVPNSALYDLLTAPKSDRPNNLSDKEWRKLWITTLLSLIYDEKLSCNGNHCDNFCTIGLLMGTTANEIYDRRTLEVVSEKLGEHGINVLSGECPLPRG